jgi:hypothetical protein
MAAAAAMDGVLDSTGRSNSGPEDISFFLSKMFVVHQF